MKQVDAVSEAYKTFNKVIDEILKHPPGPKRWRAAHDLLYLNLSERNRREYRAVIKENAMLREQVDKHGRAIGVTKSERADKTFRNALAFPHGAYYAIMKSDPRAFSDKNNAAKMFKAFPEYNTRSVA